MTSTPLVMGVVNVTPDSFSDGGRYLDAERAIAHGRRLLADGADILDIGGESTRPGAEEVAVEEELRRVVPAIERLFSVQFLAKDVYYISELPSDLQWDDVIAVAGISLLMSLVATLYPSWRASRVNPAEALRYE